MLYQIKNNYYVKVGSKYVKLSMNLDDKGELVMKPTKEKLEIKPGIIVKTIDLSKEKQNIIKSLNNKSYSRFDS